MKQILIPLDFSECSEAAAELGLEIAKKANASVTFFHLLISPVDWNKISDHPSSEASIDTTKYKMQSWVNKATKMGLEAKQDIDMDVGRDEIYEYLQKKSRDFVIMGSRGATGIDEALIGTNAQHVIRQLDVPVLIVKEKVKQPIKNIALVSDFEEINNPSFLQIIHFAELMEANISLLFINTPKDFVSSRDITADMDKVLELCPNKESVTKNVVNAESIELGLNQFISNHPIDMLAICTHGKSSFRQLFSPSIAEKIANHIPIPILSVKLQS